MNQEEINREWSDYILDGFSEEEVTRLEEALLKIARRAKEYVNSKDELEG
jgi:peptidyl-tRNA hydrolase